MSRLPLAVLLLLPASALAESVTVSFTPPEKVALFDDARLLDVKGKGGTCDQAAAAAMQAAKDKASKKGQDILAIYPGHPKSDWTPVTTLECDKSGKKATVTLTALSLHPGDAFPEVTGQRDTEIVGMLAHDDPVLPTPIGQLELVQLSGHVFYSLTTGHKDTFAPGVIRTERALEALRTDIEPNLDDWIPRIADIPELTGLRVVVSVSLSEWDDPGSSQAAAGSATSRQDAGMHGEAYEYYIPTAAGAAFVAGKLNERQLTDASGIFTSPVTEGTRLDLSSRASEQLSGPTVNFGQEQSVAPPP